ncbi:hypothetical protein HanHA300_Chr06g0200711 [Helianthus annuus]|nr:hypothetical protein HanHA300_Chr06g0200711 [Helianthus annuus]KAJ0739811.1 hypothetical protein HanOQP8_Chr06g0209821 [Helianthus annuus]
MRKTTDNAVCLPHTMIGNDKVSLLSMFTKVNLACFVAPVMICSNNLEFIFILQESLKDLKSDYHVYEDLVFEKIKGTRRSLYYSTLRLFSNDEAMLAKANAKVQKLRESVRALTEERKQLEVLFLVPDNFIKS